MSSLEPPVDWRNAGRPGDDLDGLLRAYFRSEMPEPWPPFRQPDREAPAAAPFRPVAGPPARNGTARPRLTAAVRGRLALAAAAAVLLLGTLLVAGKFHDRPPETPFGAPQAKPYWKYIQKESLLQEVEERPGPDGKPVRQDQPTKLLIEFYEP